MVVVCTTVCGRVDHLYFSCMARSSFGKTYSINFDSSSASLSFAGSSLNCAFAGTPSAFQNQLLRDPSVAPLTQELVGRLLHLLRHSLQDDVESESFARFERREVPDLSFSVRPRHGKKCAETELAEGKEYLASP